MDAGEPGTSGKLLCVQIACLEQLPWPDAQPHSLLHLLDSLWHQERVQCSVQSRAAHQDGQVDAGPRWASWAMLAVLETGSQDAFILRKRRFQSATAASR